ncbi:hypothetical protein KHM83_08075 [Fusibacter paucivorans]|uniref:Uncharacterized protein n=1 Tax=Fusibacter paucivorans TaxID=76009 RepID=A0ABS5PN77_9FIRM|nr:hypothetical protein [Fusibacter paucivorans]MBS7526630.1 hypothetical protein [Fusibacter paucivorans]
MIRNVKKINRRLMIIFILLSVLIGSLLTILYLPRLRSRVVMTASKAYENRTADQAIALSIPVHDSDTSLAWYPQMLTYNDRGGYNRMNNVNTELTIYYTFGDFSGYGSKAHAAFYDVESPYYASFFGGYVIGNAGGDWSQKPILLASVPHYDYTQLILSALGCPDKRLKFEYEVLETEEGVYTAGSDRWTRYDLRIETTGVTHPQRDFLMHDLQFGPSPLPAAYSPELIAGSFEPIVLYAVLYAKYYAAQDTEIMLYVLTADKQLLEQTDERLLSKTTLHFTD